MPRLSPIPLRQLLALVALVLCAHALLLSGDGAAWNLAQRTRAAIGTPAFEVRSVAAAPATVNAPQAALLPAATATPLPKPPTAKKRLLPTANSQDMRHPALINRAQVAPENIAALMPATEPPPVPLWTEPTRPEPDAALKPEPTPEPARTQTTAAAGEPAAAQATDTAAPSPATATAAGPANAIPSTAASADSALELKFPPSGSFAYAATILRGVQPQTGSGTLEWTSDGRAYQMRLSSSAFFVTLLSQTSVGQLGADGLLPERFGDKRINRSEKAAHFTRSTEPGGVLGRISFSGSQKQVPLQRGGQDRLSVLVQVAGLVAANPAQFAAVGKVVVQVASTEGADAWQFILQGEEQVQLPAGQTVALRLVRNPRQEYDARLELWLAPELGYLPVRIKQTEANGDSTDLQLRSPALKGEAKP